VVFIPCFRLAISYLPKLNHYSDQTLKLFDRLDIDSFNSVIRLLCAYKNDIHNMSEIYELLRGLQVGFRAPTEVDENAVLQQYPPLADNLGRQLLHLDAEVEGLGIRVRGPDVGEAWRLFTERRMVC
jgi:hypothetical protein